MRHTYLIRIALAASIFLLAACLAFAAVQN